MEFAVTVEHLPGYALVRLQGAPSLGQALGVIESLAADSRSWPQRLVLFDLRGITTLREFTEHYALGQGVARNLQHFRKLASLVPPDRITRASEKTAKQFGANLSVFVDEASAVEWLLSREA